MTGQERPLFNQGYRPHAEQTLVNPSIFTSINNRTRYSSLLDRYSMLLTICMKGPKAAPHDNNKAARRRPPILCPAGLLDPGDGGIEPHIGRIQPRVWPWKSNSSLTPGRNNRQWVEPPKWNMPSGSPSAPDPRLHRDLAARHLGHPHRHHAHQADFGVVGLDEDECPGRHRGEERLGIVGGAGIRPCGSAKPSNWFSR